MLFRSEIYGIESEFLFAPGERWRFNANIAYLHTEVKDFASVDTIRSTFRNLAPVNEQAVRSRRLSGRVTGVAVFAGAANTPIASTLMACDEALMAQEGAYLAALVAARTFTISGETLTLKDAVPLVELRAKAMQDAVPAGVGAMAAILNLDAEKIKAICAEQARGEVVQAVVRTAADGRLNCPRRLSSPVTSTMKKS